MMLVLDFFLYAFPGLALALSVQVLNWRARAAAARVAYSTGPTGAEAAARVMAAAGVSGVPIELAPAQPGDHYDARRKLLYLSERTHTDRSLAAALFAAHEAGHAIQQRTGYPGLIVRAIIVPLAAIGSIGFWILVVSGFLIDLPAFVMAGVAVLWGTLILQLVNLPVELDASRRARETLCTTEVVPSGDQHVIAKVLAAAAWRHVAASLTGLFSVLDSLRSRRLRGS
jgi:Zn-dependent membrane protease YugP